MKKKPRISRRAALRRIGFAGVAVAPLSAMAADNQNPASAAGGSSTQSRSIRETIAALVEQTVLIDTHEHLVEEAERLQSTRTSRIPCDDWALLFSHYLNSDLLTAGMPPADMRQFLSPDVAPLDKWRLLAPHWPAVKNTGYAQAVRIAIRKLYGVEEISQETVAAVQSGY